jgi:hypothetical protein
VVAVALDGLSPRVSAWRNSGSDGFVPMPLTVIDGRVAQNDLPRPSTL